MDKHISCLATTGWLQKVITPWIRKEPFLGATELRKKVEEHYDLGEIPYMRVWNATQRSVADINGTSSEDSFQLLYRFKAEVERRSPGSKVEIDHHVVRYCNSPTLVTKNMSKFFTFCISLCIIASLIHYASHEMIREQQLRNQRW